MLRQATTHREIAEVSDPTDHPRIADLIGPLEQAEIPTKLLLWKTCTWLVVIRGAIDWTQGTPAPHPIRMRLGINRRAEGPCCHSHGPCLKSIQTSKHRAPANDLCLLGGSSRCLNWAMIRFFCAQAAPQLPGKNPVNHRQQAGHAPVSKQRQGVEAQQHRQGGVPTTPFLLGSQRQTIHPPKIPVREMGKRRRVHRRGITPSGIAPFSTACKLPHHTRRHLRGHQPRRARSSEAGTRR